MIILVHLQFLLKIDRNLWIGSKYHNEYIYPYGDLNYTYLMEHGRPK
jgi:hypothetical protein